MCTCYVISLNRKLFRLSVYYELSGGRDDIFKLKLFVQINQLKCARQLRAMDRPNRQLFQNNKHYFQPPNIGYSDDNTSQGISSKL